MLNSLILRRAAREIIGNALVDRDCALGIERIDGLRRLSGRTEFEGRFLNVLRRAVDSRHRAWQCQDDRAINASGVWLGKLYDFCRGTR